MALTIFLYLLTMLYADQTASVNGSDTFPIERGVKERDIISPILFNAALELAFRRWKVRLNGHGWLFDAEKERLSNSRYADDILLYAKSLEELVDNGVIGRGACSCRIRRKCEENLNIDERPAIRNRLFGASVW